MKQGFIATFAIVALCSGTAYAQQMNCDCTQVIGSCEASVRVKPTGGPGSYRDRATSSSAVQRSNW